MKNALRVLVLVFAIVFAFSMGAYAETTYKYYVAGDFNGYANPDENYGMKSVDGGTYSVTQVIPAGEHIYKVTDGTWNAEGCFGREAYANPSPYKVDDGAFRNILFKTDKEQEVTFYFNEKTKKVADSTFYTLVQPYIVSDFFSELGIGADWDAASATTLLTDPEFDNVYTGTFKIPAGKYTFKTTIGKAWDTSYGIDGATSGMDTGIPLELATESNVTFSFDGKTHITTIKSDAASAAPTSENPKTGDADLLVPILGIAVSGLGIWYFRRNRSAKVQ